MISVLYVAYLIVGNLALNTSALHRILNRRPEAFQAQWSRAWTWWPGYLSVSDLHLWGHARQRIWTAESAHATGHFLWLPLLRHELRFKTVEASDVRVDVQPTNADQKPLPWYRDAWWITVDQFLSTSLKRLRWNDLVVTGDMAASAGFTHQLRGGSTRIFASDVRSRAAEIGYGPRWRSHDVTFDAHFAADPFTHDQPPGWQKWELATVRLTLDGTTPALDLGVTTRAKAAGATTNAEGRLRANATLDHGVLAPGSELHWEGAVATAGADGAVRRAPAQARVIVAKDAIQAQLTVPATHPPGDPLSDDYVSADVVFGSRRVLPVRSASDTLRLVSGSVAAHWHFASLHGLEPLASKKPWLQWDGAGEVDTALRIDRGRLLPGSRLAIPRLALAANVLGNRFSGVAAATGNVVATANGAASTMAMSVQNFVLAPLSSPDRAYLRGHAMRIDLQSSDDLARFRDTAKAHLQFANAQVPDLQAYNHYLPGKSLFFISGHGSMSTDLNIDGEGDVSEGHMQMRTQGAQIALGTSRLTGNLNLDTQLAVAKRTGHAFELHHFSLSMDGVQMDGANDPSWWTTVTLERGRLDWDRPMRFDGLATMRMKDLSVLLALFAKRHAFPAWIGHIVDDGQAQATSTVHAGGGEFVMDDLRASNQRVEVLARLRIADGKPNGDVYARWGLLSVGVELANDQRQFHLLHAARWYQSQMAPASTGHPASP